jgi:hypothetical protein
MAEGEHIKVQRLKGLYWHHGIDIGDGTVVHYSGEPLRWVEACICQVSMDVFLRGGDPVVVKHRGAARPPADVVKEALSHVGEQGYNLFERNCEHFACYCQTGRWKSRQVRKALRAAVGVAAGGILVVGTVTMVALRRRMAGNS